MRTKIGTLSLCVIALSIGSAAVAQDYRGRDSQRYDNNQRAESQRDRDWRTRYDRRDGRVPRELLRSRYVFDGWRERGLGKPARGQSWLKVCDSYILTSMRNGNVVEVHDAGRGRVDQQRGWRLSNSFRCMR